MRLSHSKLACILKCPMTYYLHYVQKINAKEKAKALEIGSAVHWGIEHNTEDLTQYYLENGTFKNVDNYTREQLLSESMVHGYLKHKDELFEQLLRDPETEEKLDLIEEHHELSLTATLPTFLKNHEDHSFLGIIDLLLLTNKGFIIVDYKTSTFEPDWSNYIEQLYKYIFLLKENFPDVPVLKIAIINIRKTAIRQKKNENPEQFLNRLKFEYDLNDENYINYHEFLPELIEPETINSYINNMSKMADLAQTIEDTKTYYINYKEANGQYGKSQYWDIFYNTEFNYLKYDIEDHVYDKGENCFVEKRDCIPLDMLVISNSNVLNHYDDYKIEKENNIEMEEEIFINYLKKKYQTDDELLNKYEYTYFMENC